jgi:hypothetical protein
MTDINKPSDSKHATISATATNEAARRTAEAIQQSGRAASEATHRSTQVAADLTRQGSQAGADAMRHATETATETLRRSTQAVAEGQRQMAEDAAGRFQENSRKIADVARGATEEMNSFFALPKAAEGGLRDMQQGVAGFVEGVVQTNLRATQELLRLTDPAAVIKLQQRFMRDYLDALMQGTATLVHAIRRTADETLGPLEQQVERRKQAHVGEQRVQHAA